MENFCNQERDKMEYGDFGTMGKRKNSASTYLNNKSIYFILSIDLCRQSVNLGWNRNKSD